MSMCSHFANWKWLCYLENMDSSDVNNPLVHLWNHLKISSEKRLRDAQHFLNLVYSGLRRHFALDAIVFWRNDIGNLTSNEQIGSCLSLLYSLNQTIGRIHSQINLFETPCNYTQFITYNFCWVYTVFFNLHIAVIAFNWFNTRSWYTITCTSR